MKEKNKKTLKQELLEARAEIAQLKAQIEAIGKNQASQLPGKFLLYKVLEGLEPHHFPVSVLFIDLNKFKAINDTKGHAFGDRVLGYVGKYLQTNIREDDNVFLSNPDHTGVYHPHGDEFLILLNNCSELCARIVMGRLQQDLYLEGVKITFSVGLATAYNKEEVNQAMQIADERMYANKAGH